MNKQEAIEKLKEESWEYEDVYVGVTPVIDLDDAQDIVSQIEEPQKVVVPKFVAEWLEEMKQDERPLYNVMSSLMNKTNHEWEVWKSANMNFSEIVAQAWIYGYEIEKEVLYFVEIPNPNSGDVYDYFLKKDSSTGKVVLFKCSVNPRNNKDLWLTESEIKQDFEWAWQWAKEVE